MLSQIRYTARLSVVISHFASYSGGPVFKSQPGTGYPDLGFRNFSQPLRLMLDISTLATIASFYIFSNLTFTVLPFDAM
jgi:hypothetical protein